MMALIGILAAPGLVPLPTWAQQATTVVTPDSAASSSQRPTIGTTANGRVQVDITRPGAGGVSVNRYQSFQIGRDGFVLNNSAVDGDSRIGGRVRGNPNLTGGAANVIVNQVRTATGSRLEGPVEVHGTTADVIVADPKGVTCDGCSFVNTRTGVLTSGSASVSGDKVRIDNRSGVVSIGRGGVDADGNTLLTGRRVVIDGPVRAANQLTISGGTSIIDDVVGNGLAGGVASTTTTGTSAPYAVDATAFGAMEAGSIRIIGHDSSFGVRAIGDITARDSIAIRSEADTIVKNVRAPGAIDISARQRTRIYGNVGTTTPRTRAATSTTVADPYATATLPASVVLSDVSIRGNEVYIPGGRTVEATRDVLIESQGKAVVGAEVIGRNITIRAGDLLANTGFLAATQALSVDAGAISNQREKLIVYEGQDWADAWLKAYEGVFAEWGTGADPNAVYWGNEYLNWTQTRIVDEYLLAGGSITARDITLKATAADIANNAGSIAATRDARIEAARDVLNTPVSTLLTRADENCDQTVTVCGQRTVWRGSDLVAGRDLTVIAGRDLVNRASLIGAGRNASITAAGTITADAFISEHAARLYRKIVDAPNDVTYLRDDWNNVTAALRDIGDVWETDNGNRAVIANARFIALNGDLRVSAGGDLLSIGAEFSAGATARLRAGGTMRLASLVDVNSRDYTRTQRVVSATTHTQWEGNSDNGMYVTHTTYSAVDGILETRVYSDIKAALSTVVGATVDIEAERINILGGRILSSGDLTVASRSGSIVVDSALSVLPSDERILEPNFAAWDALNALGTTIPVAPAADATDAEKAAFATYLAYERMLRDNPDYRMLTRLGALRDGWSLFSYADDIGARPTYTEIELSPAFDRIAFQAWVGDASQPSHSATYSAAVIQMQSGNPGPLNALMAQFMRAPRLPKFAMRDGKQNLTDAILDRQTGTANLMRTADVSVAMRNAMAARFVLDTGERSLGGSTRTLLIAHGDLTLENRLAATGSDPAPVGSGDIILAGGTVATAGGAIRVNADRDLVLLSLAGTGLADGSDLLSRQEDFRAGLMWRIPDLASKPAGWAPSEADWQSATITSVPATALVGKGAVTLTAGRDFANFGGSVSTESDLIVSAGRDVRNDAIRYNYILTAADGCIGGACGQYGHDYRGAELLSGRGLIVSAGRDLINGGSQIAGAGSVLLEAGNDIINEAISSQFLSTYVYKKGWFSKKVIIEYTGVMQDSVVASEFGSVSLIAGRDILNDGSTLSSGGALSLDAGRDVQLYANTQELHNVYKNRGFSGLGYGMRKVQWNNFVTAYSNIEAASLVITADRDFKAVGTKIAATEDLSIAALRDLTFDAQQNEYYRRESGWWIGFQAPLFDMIGAIARGDGAALLQQYASQNPLLAAVHDLATGRSRGVSGALSLALGSLRTLDAAGKAAMGPPTLTDGLVQQFNMSKTLGFDPMQLLSGNTSGFTSAAAGCVSDPTSCTFLGGVSLRFTAWSSQRTWTETTVSRVLAGRDMSLSAGQDAALVGGTVVSAGRDLSVVGGRNLGLAAVADNTRTRAWSWGLTFTIGQNGVSVGADGSRSLANSTIFSNAQASAVRDAVFIAGQDMNFSGANVAARTILIDAGRDLIVAS
ncbi:MAG: hemagglutinin repeat-containing protein, partial [Hyphomicrobiaceae bacterium]|nr:hemagglutinin repeat-containing protein [Hyphomicrobiaceae bacterium]